MKSSALFFICPICFEVCDSCRDCHGHTMICCDAIEAGDERRKPVFGVGGRLISRAPRWFLEAVGWIPAGYEPGAAPRSG